MYNKFVRMFLIIHILQVNYNFSWEVLKELLFTSTEHEFRCNVQ